MQTEPEVSTRLACSYRTYPLRCCGTCIDREQVQRVMVLLRGCSSACLGHRLIECRPSPRCPLDLRAHTGHIPFAAAVPALCANRSHGSWLFSEVVAPLHPGATGSDLSTIDVPGNHRTRHRIGLRS